MHSLMFVNVSSQKTCPCNKLCSSVVAAAAAAAAAGAINSYSLCLAQSLCEHGVKKVLGLRSDSSSNGGKCVCVKYILAEIYCPPSILETRFLENFGVKIAKKSFNFADQHF